MRSACCSDITHTRADLARPHHPERAEQTPTVTPLLLIFVVVGLPVGGAAGRRRLRRSGRSAGLECQCRAQRFWHPQAGVPGTRSCDARSGQELLRNNSLLQRVVRIEQQLHGGGEVLAD